jgi:hypothetical protein
VNGKEEIEIKEKELLYSFTVEFTVNLVALPCFVFPTVDADGTERVD